MIRLATLKDIKEINYFLKKFHIERSEEEFESHPFTKYVLVKIGKKAAGFLCYEEIYERYELDYIYVEEEYREQGIASALMDFFINEVKKKNGKNITLEVSNNNKEANQLYKKFGFKFAAIRKKYYGDTDGSLLMRKM